ncbi:MAG: histidine kinase [Eggerthellaceae bacterium]|nr:histidine kinase [Eggerthellaceae bacterium]
MISWGDAFYLSTISASLLSSLLGLWFAAVMPEIDRWSKRFFLGYFVILVLGCLSGYLETAFHYFPVPRMAAYATVAVETLLLAAPLPMLTAYLLHCYGINRWSSKLMHAVIGLCAIFFVLLASNQFTSWFASITSEGQIYRGPWYPLLLLPIIAILLVILTGTLRYRKRLSNKVFIGFLVVLLPMTGALVANLFVDALAFFDISFVLTSLSMYGLVLSDQIERDLRRQREIAWQQQQIANQRAGILALQMRPHFIYNTLMSIYSLCNLDPQKARQVTADFTDYLRNNFNAIASDGPVPFSAELQHARAYLAVEQAQYEDMLVVDFDTPYTHFRMPPLTLQPLVENAVKHAMSPSAGPLRICIRTRRTDAGNVITVEDNGPGFDPAVADDPQTTLANIRQRLAMMCDGTLDIASRPGGGSRVSVTIP